jgi:hypothetical protein
MPCLRGLSNFLSTSDMASNTRTPQPAMFNQVEKSQIGRTGGRSHVRHPEATSVPVPWAYEAQREAPGRRERSGRRVRLAARGARRLDPIEANSAATRVTHARASRALCDTVTRHEAALSRAARNVRFLNYP